MHRIDEALIVAVVVSVLSASPTAQADDSTSAAGPERGVGLTVSYFEMEFSGDNQVSPSTPAIGQPGFSDLRYQDAFGSGRGFEAGGYYRFNRYLRLGGSFIEETAPGRHAAGGEFPQGITFGDFHLQGLLVAGQARYPLRRFAPYVLFELGEARISPVSADTGSGSFPYWDSTNVPFMEVGFGSDFRLTPKIALTFDARIQDTGDTGHPNSAAGLVSTATGTAATMFCIGISIDLH